MTWEQEARAILKHVKKNLLRAAIHLQKTIKENVGTTGNPYRASNGASGPRYKNENPSAPGEYPAKMMGDLQRSIAYEQVGDTEVRVGTNVPYAAPLEFGTSNMAARPFIRRTLDEEADKIEKILSKPIDKP